MSIDYINVNSLHELEHLDDNIYATLHATCIRIYFNANVSEVNWVRFATLYGLELHGDFDSDISKLCDLSSLRTLHLGYYFNQDITHVRFPESMRILNMGIRFNKCIINVIFPEKLHTLRLSRNFSYNIDAIKWPTHLHTLSLNWCTQVDIADKNYEWPINLHTLEINCSRVDNIYLPKTLHILDLGEYTFQDLNNYKLPDNFAIHILILPSEFNHALPALSIKSLHTLIFGDAFNQDISNIQVYEYLHTLNLGNRFNQNISSVRWPNRLEIIKFGKRFTQDVASIFERCHQLSEITFGKLYNQHNITYNWPNSLRIIYDYSCKITKTSGNFPKSLWKIIHYSQVDFATYETRTVYERQIGSYTKAAITF
jgi:hypothetical protein